MGEPTSQPLVSVITAMYNSEKYVAETIKSVIGQTYQNWEMLIVDDKSTDNSLTIAKAFAEADDRIKIFRLERNHKLPYAARNLGTENANGKYIAFLDSDDFWHPQKLEIQIGQMETNNWVISFTSYCKQYESKPGKKKFIKVPNKVSYSDMLKTNSIGNLTAIYNVVKLGKLKQEEDFFEDYIMWLKILSKGFEAYGIQDALATYRVHNKSNSHNKIKAAKAQWSVYRRVLGLNLFDSIWYFLNYSVNGIRKV